MRIVHQPNSDPSVPDVQYQATNKVNDHANHRKAPVRRETDLERKLRLTMQQIDNVVVWGMLVPGKAKFVKDICTR